MLQRLRHAAVHVALAAILLRALLPAGWMPNVPAAGQTWLTICTMDGAQAGQHQQDRHNPDDGQRGHDECPFAAAPHVAPPVTVAVLSAASYFGRFTNPLPAVIPVAGIAPYQPQSPRAPPRQA